MSGDSTFFEELQMDFLKESAFMLEQYEEYMMRLETSQDPAKDLTDIFRVAHSVKGGATAVGLTDLSKFAHVMEDLLDLLRSHHDLVNSDVISLLLQSGDELKNRITSLQQGILLPVVDVSKSLGTVNWNLNRRDEKLTQRKENSLSSRREETMLVIIESMTGQMAFPVDDVLGQAQVVFDETELTDKVFKKLADHMYSLAGVDLPLTPKNHALIRNRIVKILRRHGLTSYEEYWALLEKGGPEVGKRQAFQLKGTFQSCLPKVLEDIFLWLKKFAYLLLMILLLFVSF